MMKLHKPHLSPLITRHTLKDIDHHVKELARRHKRTTTLIAILFLAIVGALGAGVAVLVSEDSAPTITPPPQNEDTDSETYKEDVQKNYTALFWQNMRKYGLLVFGILVGIGSLAWTFLHIMKIPSEKSEFVKLLPGLTLFGGVATTIISVIYSKTVALAIGVGLMAAGVALTLIELSLREEPKLEQSERWKRRLRQEIEKTKKTLRELEKGDPIDLDEHEKCVVRMGKKLRTLKEVYEPILSDPYISTLPAIAPETMKQFALTNKQIDAQEAPGVSGLVRQWYWGKPRESPFVETPSLPFVSRIGHKLQVNPSRELTKIENINAYKRNMLEDQLL